jgi:hypothetical protein
LFAIQTTMCDSRWNLLLRKWEIVLHSGPIRWRLRVRN